MNKTEETNYNHAEAFCLMTYKCSSCLYQETIWNSRDGVTPFIVGCHKCDGEMQHVKWNSDFPVEHHTPEIGDRIFVDLTEEKALEIARRRVEGTDWPIPEGYESEEAFIKSLARTIYNGGIEPDIAVVDEKMEAQFQEAAHAN